MQSCIILKVAEQFQLTNKKNLQPWITFELAGQFRTVIKRYSLAPKDRVVWPLIKIKRISLPLSEYIPETS